jgi:hypothetical protein
MTLETKHLLVNVNDSPVIALLAEILIIFNFTRVMGCVYTQLVTINLK